MDTTSKQYDTIPMNYGGILCCICIWLLAWVITPSLDESAKSGMYLVCIGMAFVLLGCLRHYRLDAHGVTQFYLCSKERQIPWEDVAQIGVLYTTTYAKGGGKRYIVIIPKDCELPDQDQYNHLDYLRRNEKQIIKFPSNKTNIALVQKYDMSIKS